MTSQESSPGRTILLVVHTGRDGAARVISFRRASSDEREAYGAWLEDECDDA